MCSALDLERGSPDPPPAIDASGSPGVPAGATVPAAAHPPEGPYADLLATTAAIDADGAWSRLLAAIGLASDPGAAAPLVEAIAELLTAFHDQEGESQALASIKPVAAAVLAHPLWNDGTWRRTANPSRRGGRHTGNVDERPLLACLVADRRATAERPALNALRVLILEFLIRSGEPTGAVVHVADAVRKAESMEAWRQVVRAMPRADGPGLALTDWLGALSTYLDHAEPPADLAQAPVVSIRTFFSSLQSLSQLERWWPPAWAGLPANQFRRELASAAMNDRWPGELSEQLLGHVDLGQPAFGAHSSVSPLDLQRCLPGIASMLERQGWSDLPSPLPEGPTRRGRPLPRFAPTPKRQGTPLRGVDLDEFVRLYNPANRHDRAPTWSAEQPEGRWRAHDHAELLARDKASLDIVWLRDESLADSDNLPPPDVIAQEIVDDLEAALEQFRLIAGDLGEATTTTGAD